MSLLVANIHWPGPDGDPTPALRARLGLPSGASLQFSLVKRSVDGRRRPPVWLANYRVELEPAALEAQVLRAPPHGVRAYSSRDHERFDKEDALTPGQRSTAHADDLQTAAPLADAVAGPGAPALAGDVHPAPDLTAGREAPTRPRAWPAGVRPIVVGAGPAGLFAALRFGEAGIPAVLLERGGPVEERHHAVRAFWRHAELDLDTNVVFGEGGAGAFSDGKIYTRRRDGELGWIFRRLVDFGADPEILEEGWAHLGTDRIRAILPRMRARLIELGVEVRFHAAVHSLLVEDGRCAGVQLASGEQLRGGPVLMATGHSARGVWSAMLDAGAAAEQRPIHIGARIEHPQQLIDHARYGAARGALPPASYRLTSHPPARRGRPAARAAHTFCMCPGGTVVGATNEPGRVVVNGMSYSKRQAWWANSAVIVEVRPEDYPGTDPLAGARYQDAIEQRAFVAGGGGFRAPAQRVADLLAGRASVDLPRTSYTLGVTPSDLREVLPAPLIEGLIAAVRHFDKQIPGFAGDDGVLIAPETRTTAPLRFLRDAQLESPTLPGLMPVGEGAGYAGGIVSAALDGDRAARSAIARSGAIASRATVAPG